MKHSGIEWAPTIPDQWGASLLDKVAQTGSGHTPNRNRQDWWLNGTIPWITTGDVAQLRGDRVAVIYETREQISELGLANSSAVLHPTGTVFLSRTASAGFSGIMGVEMATSQDFVTWTCGPRLEPRYLLQCLRAMRRDLLERLAQGSTHKTIYVPDIQSIKVPLPSPQVQRLIADFLDRETHRIDALVEAKRKLIDLLAEKRTALITHAVTKGLDPSVPMKESGVEWIGEIPESWDVRPIRGLARPGYKTFTDGDWVELPHIADAGIRLIQTGNIGIGVYREQGFRYVTEQSFDELGCTDVGPGDVLICRLAEPVGRACLAPNLGVRMITSVDVAILKTADDVVPDYVVSMMSSGSYLSYMQAETRGGTRGRVSRSWLGQVRVPVPPAQVQENIAAFLRRRTDNTLIAEQKLIDQLDLLAEYRQALITAAVTGQLDEETLKGRRTSEQAMGLEVPA